MKGAVFFLTMFLPVVLLRPQLGAVTIGQIQTFDEPHNWIIGAGPGLGSPLPVPTALGGPGGGADPFLLIEAVGGTGPRSRLSAQNFEEWAGDYNGAGINRIRMDVRNPGAMDIFLRLLFVEFGAMDPVGIAFTTNANVIPANSDWQTIEFDVSPSALTVLLGTAAGTLSNAGELRLFHNQAPSFEPGNNPPFVATLGVDNITAAAAITAIPEPATWKLFFGGCLIAAGLRRSRKNPDRFHQALRKRVTATRRDSRTGA